MKQTLNENNQLNFNKELLYKIIQVAKNHFKIKSNLKLSIEDKKYKYQINYDWASFDTSTNTIILSPSKFNNDISKNIRNLMFHEVAHAKETEEFGKNRFLYDIYNLDKNEQLSDNIKREIRHFFSQFQDWGIDRHLSSIDSKIPHFIIKQGIDYIGNIIQSENLLRKFSASHFITNYTYLNFGSFKNNEERNLIKNSIEKYSNHKRLSKLLDKNYFLDYKIKLKTYPKIFNKLISEIINEKYVLKKVKLKCTEILEITEQPDYLLKQDDENSIWTTFKIIV